MILHLRPSRDRVAGDLLERQALHQRHCQGSTHGQTVDETVLPRRRGMRASSRAKTFPDWSCHIVCRGPVQEHEEKGGEIERTVGKVAGNDCAFIPGRGLG